MNGARRPAVSREACGVWLDPAELRSKKPKPRLTRPVSKLLNPLAPSGGYSLAVALNFNQTRMQMPATRQTSIRSFFLPQCREEKAAVSSEPCSDPSPSALHGGPKWKHCDEDDPDTAIYKDAQDRHVDGDCELGVEPGSEAMPWYVRATPECPPLFDMQCQREEEDDDDDDDEEEEEGQVGKKRRVWRSLILGGTNAEETHQEPAVDYSEPKEEEHLAESAAVLLGDLFTQDSEGNRVLAHRAVSTERTESVGSSLDNLGCKVLFQAQLCDRNASVQKRQRFPTLRLKKEGKENNQSAGVWGQRSGLESPLKQTTCSLSAQLSGKGSCLSPRKTVLLCLQEEEGDSFSKLFTQDSQGQRVIAHRNFQTRSPLKDQTNWTGCKGIRNHVHPISFDMLLGEDNDEDLDPEILFTQDSQGNMVIKH